MLSIADSYFGLLLQIVSTMIIARVLTPKQVGVFAVAAVFSGLASMFRDFGVAEYLIQEKDLTRQKLAATLTLNIAASWSMAAALFVGAVFAARFYDSAGVADVMRVQSITFLLVPFGAVTMAYFRRELDYAPVLICNVAGSIASFVTGIALALLGFGYMSLAWASVTGVAVTVVGSLFARPRHLPLWPGLADIGTVFHYSKFASLVYIVGQLGKGAPEMIIGRVLTLVDVAMFSRANGLVELVNRLLLRSVMQVCMPYFAKNDRDGRSALDTYLKSVSYLTAVGWPLLGFLAVAAFPVIRIVYGDQWDAAVPLARILCAAFAVELLSVLSREMLLARGEAKQANALQIRQQCLLVIGLLAAVPFGLAGAAWGVLVASGCALVLGQTYLARVIALRMRDLAQACLPSAILCVVSVGPAAAWLALRHVGEANYISFGLVAAIVTASAWLTCIHLIGHPLGRDIFDLGRRLRGGSRMDVT
jgi:O-antigen/teichoic acid export membrane protein